MPTALVAPLARHERQYATCLPDPGHAIVNLIEIAAAPLPEPAGPSGEAGRRRISGLFIPGK
jgi:hypothetical protein